MKRNKAYKFRLYPDSIQKQFFEQNFGNARFIYNIMLEDKIKHYEKTKTSLYNTPAQYKDKYEFLKKSDSLGLANEQLNLEKAYRSFFRNPKHFGFPKFKSKHKSKYSYSTNNQNIKGKNTIFIDNGKIRLPKIGFVKIIQDREFKRNHKIKTVTISRTRTNKYFASILIEYECDVKLVNPVSYIGLDFSMSDLYVDSNGNVANSSKLYRENEAKLAKEQRKLSNKVRGSSNYKKQKLKVARVHEKIANKRKDFLHKKSREIANLYDVVCIEDLNMSAMSKTFKFGKSVHDNGWGMFVNMLSYKMEESGKYLIKADKWFPSSKQCSGCGNKKEKLKLSERIYHCVSCDLEIDRDLNAAYNLKQYGIDNMKL
ncbi:MAG TPA: IS200/IS605 family element transposase accessory protein TnpB [Clostridiales bacterium]|nr:IS200/IS605 family element transposase accessory protein TnpB [Clostridiales bacterium]